MDIRSFITKPPRKSNSRAAAMLRAAGCGFGYHGSADRCSLKRHCRQRLIPLAPQAPHVPGPRQARDLPLHARRPLLDRHLRSQALPRRQRRQAAAHQAAAHLRGGQDRRPDEVALAVQELRPSGLPDQRSVPAHPRVRRRSLRGSFHGRRRRGPWRGAAADLHRDLHLHPPQHGFLGALRTRHGEPQSARLHHHQARAIARRREELGFRIPARLGAGHRHRPRRHAGRRDSEGTHRVPDEPGTHAANSSVTSST